MEPAAPGLNRRGQWLLPSLLLACALTLIVAGPGAVRALLPVQGAILVRLLPEFEIGSLAIEQSAGHWLLSARMNSRIHLVAYDRVMPPGVPAEVGTPAGAVQRMLLALCAGGLWLCRRRRPAVPVVAVLLGGAALAVVSTPVVMAGQIWSLYLAAAEPSLAYLLARLSQFLLHGGDCALLGMLFYLGAGSADHRPPEPGWFFRTMPDHGPNGPGAIPQMQGAAKPLRDRR